MYDIEELEAQWKRYRMKRYLRHALIAVILLAVLLLPILYYTIQPFSGGEKDTNTVLATAKPQSSKAEKQETATVQGRSSHEEVLKTEVPTMRKEPAQTKPKMMISFSDQAPAGSPAGQRRGKVELDMVKKANRSVVREIERRFPLSRDYDDAMYLAKYYYGKKDYKKSEYWAMQANMVDSTRPESWILFGKSKAKRGRRKDALKVLQAYYDRTGNMEVKQLIDRIRKGREF
ncbi:hypothetical protein [Nitratifractor sp.]